MTSHQHNTEYAYQSKSTYLLAKEVGNFTRSVSSYGYEYLTIGY